MKDIAATRQGLYFRGELKATNYTDALKVLFELVDIPTGFIISENHPANGYSVVDSSGVQHVYELTPGHFYTALRRLPDFVEDLNEVEVEDLNRPSYADMIDLEDLNQLEDLNRETNNQK